MDNVPPTREQLEQEVTDLRRQLSDAAASRDRFRDLVESTSDWVWEINRDGLYTYVSPRARDMLGREPDDLIGTSPFDIMPPPEAKRLAKLFQDYVSRAEPFDHIENICLHADGREILMETSGVPVHAPDGTLMGYRGVDRDITGRKRAEAALRESEATARALLDAPDDVALLIEPNGRILALNESAAQRLGGSEKDLVGVCAFDLFPPELVAETSIPYDPEFLKASLAGVPLGLLHRNPTAPALSFDQLAAELEARMKLSTETDETNEHDEYTQLMD